MHYESIKIRTDINFYIPVRGQIKEACWVIKKISLGDIKILPSGFGVRQLAPFIAFC